MTALLLLACNDTPTEPYSGDWEVPKREQLLDLDLPPNPNGPGYVIGGDHGGLLIADPANRTPLSAAGECAALVVACYAPDERSIGGCLQNVPVCDTDTPWEGDDVLCCAEACTDAFYAGVDEGESDVDAFIGAVFGPQSCSPGLLAWVEETS
jgi:hypothetical protein